MGRKILIVEDEMIVQMHLQSLVSQLGYDVIGTASNTQEALEIAEREAPELVLMDIHLEGGSDGVETAQLLTDSYACAVVFVTAYADDETVERTGAVGAAGYLVKPFTTAQVRAAISTAFAGHGRLQQAQERERALATVLVSTGDAIFVTDEAGTISFANPRAAELTGRPAREACDRDLLEVLHFATESDAQAVRDALAQVQAESRPVSFSQLEVVGPDGSEHPVSVEIGPVADADLESSRLIVMLRDRRRREVAAPARSADPGGLFGAGTRLLVYSHDTFGLGHLRRCLNLIRALTAQHDGLSVLLVTGSPMVHQYKMPAGTDYLKLPAVRKVASERYEARSLSISGDGIHTLRSNLLLRTIRDYDPNVLLVDHSPVGMKGELRPALEWLAGQGGCTRILGLRDIIDEPASVTALWNEQGVYDVLRDYYDHVAVYGSQDFYDTVRQYEFPEAVAAKTRFVNHVCDQDPPPEAEVSTGDGERPLVAVSIGGGDGGAEAVIGSYLDMLERFAGEIDFHTEILTGPFVDAELEQRFRERARSLPVNLENFIPSTAPLYRRAELVVSTVGYNTATDLLRYARRAVLIPRVLHRHEQLIRARRMDELGLARCLHPEEVTAQGLYEAIQSARRSPEEPLRQARETGRVPLDGAQRFAAFCGELWVGPPAARPNGV